MDNVGTSSYESNTVDTNPLYDNELVDTNNFYENNNDSYLVDSNPLYDNGELDSNGLASDNYDTTPYQCNYDSNNPYSLENYDDSNKYIRYKMDSNTVLFTEQEFISLMRKRHPNQFEFGGSLEDWVSWSGANFVRESYNVGHYAEIKKFEIVDGEECNYDTVEMVEKLVNENNNQSESYLESDENFVSNNEEWEVVEDEVKYLEGLTITKYGKGLFIKCPKEHKDYGSKYYHNGWWMKDGWFFKMNFYEYLIQNGAIPSNELLELPFFEMSYEYYDSDTILLQCYDTHPNYRDAEYYGAKWNYQADGWLFKRRDIKYLENNGAIYESQDDYKLLNCKLSILESGTLFYLITPNRLNKYYGIKKFNVNSLCLIWVEDYKGWTIYHEDKNLKGKTEQEKIKMFTDMGAVYVE